MPEGKLVDLSVMEKEDLQLFTEWVNNPEFLGEYFFSPTRFSITEMETRETSFFEFKTFIIEKKDGSKIGYVSHYNILHPSAKVLQIDYALVPNERGKGYCSEAVKIMVDYLFLSKDVAHIQAYTDLRNLASQKVLEKAGFKREGILLKSAFARREWNDYYEYSIAH